MPHPTAPQKPLRAYGVRDGDGIASEDVLRPAGPAVVARARRSSSKRFAEMHGLKEPIVATMGGMRRRASRSSWSTAHSKHAIDVSAIEVPEVRTEALSREEIESRIKSRLGRKIIVVGACTGADAHTVGIDAILNYKGYAGDKGLESYKGFEAYNLGAQVENEQLAARALALKADAILVSQIITQRNVHKENAAALIALAKQGGWRSGVIMLFGGPRVDHKLALELGFDAGFGPGTKPSDVASYLVERLCGDATKAKPPMG